MTGDALLHFELPHRQQRLRLFTVDRRRRDLCRRIGNNTSRCANATCACRARRSRCRSHGRSTRRATTATQTTATTTASTRRGTVEPRRAHVTPEFQLRKDAVPGEYIVELRIKRREAIEQQAFDAAQQRLFDRLVEPQFLQRLTEGVQENRRPYRIALHRERGTEEFVQADVQLEQLLLTFPFGARHHHLDGQPILKGTFLDQRKPVGVAGR